MGKAAAAVQVLALALAAWGAEAVSVALLSMEEQLRVLARRLQAEQLTMASVGELQPAFMAISDRLRELAGQGSSDVQAREIATLLRALAQHSDRCTSLAGWYVTSFETLPAGPQELELALAATAVSAMADAAGGVVQGLQALEQQQQQRPAARLDHQTVGRLLRWLSAMLPAEATFLRQVLLTEGSVGSPLAANLGTVALLAGLFIAHCCGRAGQSLYSAALQQVQRSVPLFLGCLVPGLYRGAEPGRATFSAEQWKGVFNLLLTLLDTPQLHQAAGAALASGPPTSPLGQQLASAVLRFLRRLADQGPWVPSPARGDSQSAEEKCWALSVGVLGTKLLSVYVHGAVTAGPAALQLQRALTAMLGQLRQQLRGNGAAERLRTHRTVLAAAGGTLQMLLHIHMEGLDTLLDARHSSGMQGPRRQRVEQLCLSAALSCFQAAEAVPHMAAALQRLVALSREAAPVYVDTGRDTRIFAGLLSTLGCVFKGLIDHAACPRWQQQGQAEQLAQGLEAGLRCAGALQQAVPQLGQQAVASLERAAADACSYGLGYVAAWAAQQERQGTLALEATSADALLARLGSLASSALKCLVSSASLAQEGAAWGLESPQGRLGNTLGKCCKLAALALAQLPLSPPQHAARCV
ncbi:hypothetical protein ABPG75_005571 [Micractinium tetrahymenae]